jgi:hypothetical protein
MASKSIRQFDSYIDGLDECLRAFKALPKEASHDLRLASTKVAERHMLPAWRSAALTVDVWGQDLAASMRVKKDRLPAIKVGFQKKVFSGGASTNMVRWPSSTGEARNSFAPFENTHWLSIARDHYVEPAMQEWGRALEDTLKKWSDIV